MDSRFRGNDKLIAQCNLFHAPSSNTTPTREKPPESTNNLNPPTALPNPPDGKSFRLSFHDEFNGAELDDSRWNIAEGPRRDGLWRRDAVSLDGKGNLVISIFKDGNDYIDGEVDTLGKFEQTYGYFVARAKLHGEEGHWSAFWLMPRDICGKWRLL